MIIGLYILNWKDQFIKKTSHFKDILKSNNSLPDKQYEDKPIQRKFRRMV